MNWIKVADGNILPPFMVTVIATNGRTVCEAKYYPYSGKYMKHGWYQVDGMILGVGWATYWMPMPTPPEVKP